MRSWMKKKYFTLLLQSSVVLAVFIGCSSTRNHTFSALNNQENTDTKLPVVHSVKTINDVSSVGFEWYLKSLILMTLMGLFCIV